MTLWFVLALMTAAAIFAVLWPLARQGRNLRSGSDVAVYRDQLDEIDRDRAAGRIADSEADRRAGRGFAPADRRRRCASRAAGHGVPRIGGVAPSGSRDRRSSPAAARCRGTLSRARLALAARPAAGDARRRCQAEPVDGEPDRAGREPPRAQSRGRPRLGGDRADLSAAGPLRGRGEGAAPRASPQRRDRRAPDRARRGAG